MSTFIPHKMLMVISRNTTLYHKRQQGAAAVRRTVWLYRRVLTTSLFMWSDTWVPSVTYCSSAREQRSGPATRLIAVTAISVFQSLHKACGNKWELGCKSTGKLSFSLFLHAEDVNICLFLTIEGRQSNFLVIRSPSWLGMFNMNFWLFQIETWSVPLTENNPLTTLRTVIPQICLHSVIIISQRTHAGSSPSTQEGLLRVVPATFPGKQEHLTVWERSSMRFLLQHRWAAITSHVPPSADGETDTEGHGHCMCEENTSINRGIFIGEVLDLSLIIFTRLILTLKIQMRNNDLKEK